MKNEFAKKIVVSAFAVALVALTAEARDILYYFDFDKVENGALVYQGAGVNRGTGTSELTFKWANTPDVKYTSPGAFGSNSAYYSSSNSSLWLGDGSNSLGCGTVAGFTLSFWLKTSGSHGAWTDFFGFRVGGYDYRCEYTTGNSSDFTMYCYISGAARNMIVRDSDGGEAINHATAGEWKHVAYVFKPDGTNGICNCYLYVGGERVARMNVAAKGNLQQIHIGPWVRNNGGDRITGANSTGIDEFAVFDYPMTDEHVKWAARRKPAQPVGGPGRAMPIAWLLDEGGDSTGGVLADNSGTGKEVAYRWADQYFNWIAPPNTALCSTRSFHLNNYSTYRVDGASPTEGLGATLGSGLTLSFWLKAPGTIASLWSDFMGFRIGNRFERFEWDVSNPVGFHIYGTSDGGNDPRAVLLTADTWQHVCMVWNDETSRLEFYLDGEKQGHYVQLNSASADESLKTFIVGTKVFNNNGNNRQTGGRSGTYVDEVAIFNHSLSLEQIHWLTNKVPCLPPLDATNLVRTVYENSAWAGGRASWRVKDTSRTTIYPSCEDIDAEVELTLADGVTFSNDTFVTPKRLVLASSAAAGTAALHSTAGSLFAPQALEVGEGMKLTVPLYAVNVEGALTLGVGSKITFDTANFNNYAGLVETVLPGSPAEALSAGVFILPAGETDILAHFAVTDARFKLSLSADGKKVLVSADAIPVTATWTGTGDGESLGNVANWSCLNASGNVIADALPCEFTRVIVCSGSAAMNAPVDTAIPWPFLRIEAGDATLAADIDWRGLGAVTFPLSVTVNLNGKDLYLAKMTGGGTITDTAATGGELHVDVPQDATSENAAVTLSGSLKLVKEGVGAFVAGCVNQKYTGGTEVAEGTLRLGTNVFPLGPKNALVKVCEGALYDMDSFCNTKTCIYCYDLAGTFHLSTGNRNNGWNTSYKCIGSTLALSGDATMTGGGFYFANPDGTLTISMNGHTLTFDTKEFGSGQANSYVGFGAISASTPGKILFLDGMFEWLAGTNPKSVDVEVRKPALGKLGNATESIDIGGLVYGAEEWSKNEGKATRLNVHGTYLVGPMRPPMVMMDGSTLDFSVALLDLAEVYESTNDKAEDCTTPGELLFADGATINVKFGDRAVSSKEPIIAWAAMPANIDGVKFESVPGEKKRSFVKKDDGLYAITRGFSILVR